MSLIDATIEHSPAAVDLTGPALADAMSDPHAPGHSRLIALWLADFTSPHTRAAYYGDLLAFARYANAHGLNMLHASKADVAGFKAILEDLDGDHLSPASVARRISAVSSFYRHLEHEGVTTANPALLVRRPKVSEESMTQALTRSEAARLLEAADTAGPRDHALICLLLLNGLRVGSLRGEHQRPSHRRAPPGTQDPPQRVITNGRSEVLDVGRKTRVIPTGLRTAVEQRDKCCRASGCDTPAWSTEVHHIIRWANGGTTSRSNCCLFCRKHHKMIHHGWTVTGDANRTLTFTAPDGTRYYTHPPG